MAKINHADYAVETLTKRTIAKAEFETKPLFVGNVDLVAELFVDCAAERIPRRFPVALKPCGRLRGAGVVDFFARDVRVIFGSPPKRCHVRVNTNLADDFLVYPVVSTAERRARKDAPSPGVCEAATNIRPRTGLAPA